MGLQLPLAAGGISSPAKSWWLLLLFLAGAEAGLLRVVLSLYKLVLKESCRTQFGCHKGRRKEPCLISERKSTLSKINCCSLSKLTKQDKNVTADVDLCPASGRTQFDPIQNLCVLSVRLFSSRSEKRMLQDFIADLQMC